MLPFFGIPQLVYGRVFFYFYLRLRGFVFVFLDLYGPHAGMRMNFGESAQWRHPQGNCNDENRNSHLCLS